MTFAERNDCRRRVSIPTRRARDRVDPAVVRGSTRRGRVRSRANRPRGYRQAARWFQDKGREWSVESRHGLGLDLLPIRRPRQRLRPIRCPMMSRSMMSSPMVSWSRSSASTSRTERRREYQLPLAVTFRDGATGGDRRDQTAPDLPTLSVVDAGAAFWADVVDAVRDERVVPGVRGVFSFVRERGPRTDRIWAAFDAMAASERRRVRALGADQTNTSSIVGESYLIKAYRRTERGIHPEIELLRALERRAPFEGVPAMLGSVEYRANDDGETRGLAILSEFVADAVDAWSFALDRLSRSPSPNASDESPWLSELGRVTADMHLALASATAESTRVSGSPAPAEVRASIDRLVAEVITIRELADRRDSILECVTRRCAAADDADCGGATRVHGDYHLGQVLRAGDSFLVVDFEGEPARSLEERRRPASPLKDAAGMLRSFEYAIETASDGRDSEGWAAWRDVTRRRFLDAYWRTIDADATGAELVPRSESSRARWLAVYELEKLLYEVIYETRNRPDYRWIPVHGLERAIAEIESC